jgi:hypothetical protein
MNRQDADAAKLGLSRASLYLVRSVGAAALGLPHDLVSLAGAEPRATTPTLRTQVEVGKASSCLETPGL